MADPTLQPNLGSLRSTMTLTLHTHHATRIWTGRAAREGRPAILGLSGFLSIMHQLKHAAERDDPYADWWLLQVEEKIADTRTLLDNLRQQVEQVLASAPAALTLGDNGNLQPVQVPLFINAQLGFLAVYLLADYDALARRLILAHHTALIDRRTLERWLNSGGHALRSLFAMTRPYRPSGVTRADFATDNARARAAQDRLGEPPMAVLQGHHRSRFAPPLLRSAPPLLRSATTVVPSRGDKPLAAAHGAAGSGEAEQ